MLTAVAGKVLSGVEVARMIRSMIGRRQPGIVERRACRRLAERRRGLAFAGDVALADAGALHDPLVGRLDLAISSS